MKILLEVAKDASAWSRALSERLPEASIHQGPRAPRPIHKPYWTTCFELTNGEEVYVQNCPQGVAPQISAAGVAAIVKDPDIRRSLTEWAGFTQAYSGPLESQNGAAKQALALIDPELAKAD